MAMSSLDERLLVEAHNGGDPEAFADIVREYQPGLYAHALMRLNDARAAEDAVQETFLRAYRSMPQFDGQYHLRAWLHRILTNVCYDEGDRRRREVRMRDRLSEFAIDAAPPPDEIIDLDRQAQELEVHAAMATLPDSYREALELRYVDELSFRQVADVTGVTEENARARVHRGRSALRRLLNAPLAVVVFLIPALRRGERAASAAESAFGHAESASAAAQTATVASSGSSGLSALQSVSPTLTRIAVEVSGPFSTKASIVVGVVAAASTVAVPAVGSTVVDNTFAAKPSAQVQSHDGVAADLGAPAGSRIEVNRLSKGARPGEAAGAAGAVAAGATGAGASTTAVAAAGDVAGPNASNPALATDADGNPTFSAPNGATSGALDTRVATDLNVSAGTPSTVPGPAGATPTVAPPPPATSAPVALSFSGLQATVAGGRIDLTGNASTSGGVSLSGPIEGRLVLGEPGATATDPVRLDGTLRLTTADGAVVEIRIAARVVLTDAGGTMTLSITAGRYDITGTPPAGMAASGTVSGSLAVGDAGGAANASFSLD